MVFKGLQASVGQQSVVGMQLFLTRLDELAASPNEADKAAIASLEKRNITAAERARLAAFVARAKAAPEVPASPVPAADEEAQMNALRALRVWFEDWSETARATIKKRAHLIVLGLAKRRTAGSEEPEDEGGGPATPPAT